MKIGNVTAKYSDQINVPNILKVFFEGGGGIPQECDACAAGGSVDIQAFPVIKIPFSLHYRIKFVWKKYVKIPFPYWNYVHRPRIF
jgi:hypothetical protein